VNKPKILIAASIYPPDAGGPAVHAKKQFEWWRNQGYQAEVVALAHYRKWPRWLRHFLFLRKLLVKALRSEVIYAHDAWGVGFPALVAARLTRNKLILRVGGDMAWEREVETKGKAVSIYEWYRSGMYRNNLFYKLTRIVLQRADMLVVPTELLRRVYIEYYDLESTRIAIIPNPIPSVTAEPKGVEQTIVFASRLVAYKNLDFVLNSLKTVFADYPELKLVVMGDGPERSNLEDLAKALLIDSQVEFRGVVAQSEVLEKTSTCLFALAPALTEFNPNYVLQCMSFGKPFIISSENGLPFKVPEELVFDPKNAKELESRVRNLLTKDGYEKAQQMIKSITFIKSWEDNLKENTEIINSLVK
jgi:glycosyltransferase involved in cell wall biosynthesis